MGTGWGRWSAAWVIVLALALLPTSAMADGPASYQVDPAHSGAAAGTSFAPPLGKRWVRRDLGDGASFPVIAEGKAFVAAGQSVHALDLASGATVWSRPIATTGVAYDDGRVFAVDNRGVMHGLSAADGKKVWTAQLAGASSYFSPPTAYGDFVYVSGDYSVFGVRQDDGIVVWAENASSSQTSIPAVDADKVYVAAGCGDTTALQRTVGAEIWHHGGECSGSSGSPSVALHGDRVYSGQVFGSSVVLLESLTGFLSDNVAGAGPPAFGGDVGFYRGANEVFARSESSGLVQWRRPLGESVGTAAPPLVAGDFVYVLTNDRRVLALARGNGHVAWERGLTVDTYYPSSSDSSVRPPGLAAAGNTLLVAAGDRVTAFTPGPDTPGIDDPDKPPANGGRIALEPSARRTVFGRAISVRGRFENYTTYSGKVEIQADPWPYGVWERARDIAIDSASSFEFVLKPSRNTRYRAVYHVTNPPIGSNEFTVFSDVRLAFRVFARGRRQVLVKLSAAGPREAKLRTRRVFVYHYRPGSRVSRRLGPIKLRGSATKARGARRFRTPALGRRDLFFICRKERRDDGFGRPDKRLRLCGRRLIR